MGVKRGTDEETEIYQRKPTANPPIGGSESQMILREQEAKRATVALHME